MENAEFKEIKEKKKKPRKDYVQTQEFSVADLVVRGVGRPKGRGNDIDRPLKARMNSFLQDHFDQFEQDFNALPPMERASAYVTLYKHAVPKAVKTEDDNTTSAVKEFVEKNLF